MRESGRMEWDRGGVYEFHEESKEFDAPSTVNVDKHRDGEKETDKGEDD